MKRRTLLLALLVSTRSLVTTLHFTAPRQPFSLVFPGQRDRTPDDVVQPPVHPGAGHLHGAVCGNQHRQLEVQVHQPDRETVEGQREPGLGHLPVLGHTVTDEVFDRSALKTERRNLRKKTS